MEKRTTPVQNAKSPSVKQKIWKDICSPISVSRSPCAQNATIQPIKLLIFDATLWRTLGKKLKSATSEIILQFIQMISKCIKKTALVKNHCGLCITNGHLKYHTNVLLYIYPWILPNIFLSLLSLKDNGSTDPWYSGNHFPSGLDDDDDPWTTQRLKAQCCCWWQGPGC